VLADSLLVRHTRLLVGDPYSFSNGIPFTGLQASSARNLMAAWNIQQFQPTITLQRRL